MNRKGNVLIGALVVVIVLCVIGYLGSFLLRPAPTTNAIPTPAVNPADIDRSGAADEGDRIMVQKHVGCVKDQPCWNTTVGKTKDGDNPIYVFDLDLDKDGTISQKDIDLIR